MKKQILLIVAIASLCGHANAQKTEDDGVLNGSYYKCRINERQPVPYQHVRESDVMWSKTLWRIIDLRQKMNLKLYYPKDGVAGAANRFSLIDLMLQAIENEGIKAYDPNADTFDEFAEIISLDQIKGELGAVDETIEVEVDGNWVPKVVPGDYNSAEIKEIMVKEEWFFDKQRSVMEVRIIGLCPIRHYYKDTDIDQEDVQKKKLFWIYFPDIRGVFANHMVFNPYNEASHWSFDDIFHLRYFDSYIFKESNTYDDRLINEYTKGRETLYESEKIKRNIANYEMDLWVY